MIGLMMLLILEGGSRWSFFTQGFFAGVCGLWCSVVADIHRFFIAVAVVAVNEDGAGGSAIDPCVWSGAAPKKRKVKVRVRDYAILPGRPSLWEEESTHAPRATVGEEDVSACPYSVSILVMITAFLDSLH